MLYFITEDEEIYHFSLETEDDGGTLDNRISSGNKSGARTYFPETWLWDLKIIE